MKEIDARGLACPRPVLMTKEFVETSPQEEVRVIIDNEASRENVSRFLESRGYAVRVETEDGGIVVFGSAPTSCEAVVDTLIGKSESEEKILVLIPTDCMGRGDDELGRKLIKNFVATLREMGDALWRVVLVNNGVKLTIEGAETLRDLQELEESGVRIFVCGTCLDFFGLLDQKRVGETTNMLDVVTSMQLANKVISV